MNNWERKLSYLHHEIVKFGKYIDALHAAQVQKEKVYAARSSVPVREGPPKAGQATSAGDTDA